jgi:ParB family chromosome partitioning protein
MRLDAMKRLPGRPSKDNYSPVGNNFEEATSSQEMAKTVGESKTQIFRYIRLTELEPELLEMVDEGKIALRPAVELSYLNDIEQQDLIEAMDIADATPSHAQTIKMRKFSEEGKLSPEVIEAIMMEEKPNQKEKFTFKAERIRQYIPKSVPYEKTEEYVFKALEHYQRFLERQRDRDR